MILYYRGNNIDGFYKTQRHKIKTIKNCYKKCIEHVFKYFFQKGIKEKQS